MVSTSDSPEKIWSSSTQVGGGATHSSVPGLLLNTNRPQDSSGAGRGKPFLSACVGSRGTSPDEGQLSRLRQEYPVCAPDFAVLLDESLSSHGGCEYDRAEIRGRCPRNR